MDKRKHFHSLSSRIMISALVPVVISFILIGALFFVLLLGSLREATEAKFLQVSQKYAYHFEHQVDDAMNYLSIMASELEIQTELGITDRETLQKMVQKIFSDYALIDGSSIYFEPNEYDGRDAEFCGSEYGTDASGRICWYFYKDDGKTAYLPEAQENDIEFSLPHYADAKAANRPICTDPMAYEIDGKNISMFTLTHPIRNSSGQFIGAVTVDLFLDDIYTQLQDEQVYKTGYVLIVNEDERIFYSPDCTHIGKTRAEAGIQFALPFAEETSTFFRAKSILNGRDTLVSVNTIYIPQLDSNFYITVSAPTSEINEDILRFAFILVMYGLLAIGIITVFLYYSVQKISAPIKEITDNINKIAEGEYSARIKGRYTGEFSVVKDSVNKMADSIETYIHESDNSLNILKSILNGLDAFIYVTVPDTGEILFINDNMRKHYDIESDCVGSICYQVLQDGMDEKCEFCPCYQLDKNPDKAVVWEENSTLTKRSYRNTDCYIDWLDGEKVHLQHSVDITDMKMTQLALDRRLRQQSLMAAISQSFLSEIDLDALIANALQMTGNFLDVAQILFYQFEEDGVTLTCQSEWINSDVAVESRIGEKLVLKGPMLSVLKNTSEGEETLLTSNNPAMKAAMAPYRLNFQNYICSPLFLKGNIYGVLDFSRVDDGKQWSQSDINLAALVSNLLSGVFERHHIETQLIVAKELAEQGSRSKSEFLSRMSHEIRTPMNAIIGMTSIAQSSADPVRKDYCLEKIEDASQHLLGVINDILDMSKIEANKFDLSSAEFNFEKMLQKVVNVNNFRIDEKHQNFTVHIDKNIPRTLIGDDQRLAQVITNLLSNAVKFTPEGGSLRLDTHLLREEGSLCTLRIDVTDTGIGISEEQQSRIFTSFEQAENSTARKFGGTGLGLAISKSIIEMMGGEIWIESELGKGATFSFTVLLERGQQVQRSLFGSNVNRGNIRLLAVDDAPEIREYFADIAERFGIACDTAAGGEEALAMIERNGCYNLFFVDWKMPGMDGIELSRRIKATDAGDCVIIMISAAEWSAIETDAHKVGVDKFLPKPLFPSAISDCINDCLGINAMPAAEDTPPQEMDCCLEGYRVLLAEDLEINREIVLAMLEPTLLTIDCAKNGVEAVRIYRETPERYDLIFMDVQMPEMDGYEATRSIRALDFPAAQSIPIIAMTANVFREDIEKCLMAGMNDHVGKPIAFDELFVTLRKYLPARPIAASSGLGQTPLLQKAEQPVN